MRLRVARRGRACGLYCGRARSPAPTATHASILNGRIVVKRELALPLILRVPTSRRSPGPRHGQLSGDDCGHNHLMGAVGGASAEARGIASYLLKDLARLIGDGPRVDR